MSIKAYLNEEGQDTMAPSERRVVIREVDEESSSSTHSPVDATRPMPIQQGRVMNGKAVLLEPSTHRSFISTAPTSVSLIYSRFSSNGFV